MDYMSDIVIIGAGAVGTAIAREFSKYQVRVMVVDKRDDVGGDASNPTVPLSAADLTVRRARWSHSCVWLRGQCLTGLLRNWIYPFGSAAPLCPQ